MIVYGDLERVEDAALVKAGVATALRGLDDIASALDRHAALVGAFIRAAELVQGVADAEFAESRVDRRTARQEAGARLLLALAAAVDRSWTSGFEREADVDALLRLLESVRFVGDVRTRTGEGFAHYALYPESYLEAARRSGLGASTCVIGLRSIGIGLGALVAAALGAAPAVSLRPVGHPFDRRIDAEPGILGGAVADPEVGFAVVDEGPGLSGSSLASVARWLADQGVAPERIHFFPAHEGQPGPSASPQIRQIWSRVTRHPASRHEIVLHPRGLRRWLEEKLGPLHGPLQSRPSDPEGGASGEPRDTRFERQKFIARTAEGDWLVKFAGLGAVGERKFRDARTLAAGGFGAETVAFCHGFIVQRWIPGAAGAHGERTAFLARLGDYLAFRASGLGDAGPGASLRALREMAVCNVAEALGSDFATLMDRRLAAIDTLQHRVRPVRSDNRLHAWEWLAAGRSIVKLDAIDHCESHDLIGCQDIAWDVAGSVAEYDLDDRERAALCRGIAAAGSASPDAELVSALLPCYLAFQLGLWSTATPRSPRTDGLANAYAGKLVRLLQSQPTPAAD